MYPAPRTTPYVTPPLVPFTPSSSKVRKLNHARYTHKPHHDQAPRVTQRGSSISYTRKPACSTCAGSHNQGNCTSRGETFKCFHCKIVHIVSSTKFPLFIEESFKYRGCAIFMVTGFLLNISLTNCVVALFLGCPTNDHVNRGHEVYFDTN